MQFEQPAYQPFGYPQGTYTYPTTAQSGMPRATAQQFSYDYGIPTPAPSPRASGSRRRSNTQAAEFMGGEYVKRPSSSRRHESYGEFDHRSTSSPRPATSHGRAQTGFMHTPLHTPPPPAHPHHGSPMPHGTPMPNIYSYGAFPTAEYFVPSYTPAPGHQSPPPFATEGRRSRTHHRRENTWAGDSSARSPPRTGSAKPAPPTRASTTTTTTTESTLSPEQEELRRKAAAAGIPSDYSLKNWDPTERPIILLGSVFDANSLGEWVFNWTKYHHGRTHEATRTAGGLWELLIELSSKLKRAREFFDLIRAPENREILEEFMESGERLWHKLKNLLKACEEYMWTGARRVSSPKHQDGKAKVQMGKQSGAEFVDAMFNGEKEWEKTERLMRGMATWCHRFQVNCEDILMRPDA